MKNNINVIGKKFGMLTILAFSEPYINKTDGFKRTMVLCKCDCGNIKIITGTALRKAMLSKKGGTHSCGCLLTEYLERLPRLLVERNIKIEGYSAQSLVLHRYKVGAKARNLPFELSREQTINLCSSNCYYCGIQPCQLLPENRVKNGNFLHNGIDRIDNDKGYTEENCVPCCHICNMAKRNLTLEEFNQWIERLIKFRTR